MNEFQFETMCARRHDCAPGGHVGVGEVVLETCFHFSNKKFVEFWNLWNFFLFGDFFAQKRDSENKKLRTIKYFVLL